MNAVADALDRTLRLVRDELRPDTPDDILLSALTDTEIALVADAKNLASPAAQTAFVTTALLCARSGHKVYLLAPDVALSVPQPPLQGTAMITALLECDTNVVPARRFVRQLPRHMIDLEIRFGTTASCGIARTQCAIGATCWSARITRSGPMGPWMPDLVWPMGAMAGAVLASVEAFKGAMQKLVDFARDPAQFVEFFAPLADTPLVLAPEATPMVSTLGAFDVISGGAITNGTLYALARLPNAQGVGRIVEADTGEMSNLNRYMLMRVEDIGKPKADLLAALDLGGLTLKPLPRRYESLASLGAFAPRVLVGVDHIPTRWAVQQAGPHYLGIGATTHWSAMASYHLLGQSCAGCAHPRDDVMEGPIPTVAFVSFLAALLQTADFLRDLAGLPATEALTYVTVPRADKVWRSPIAVHRACPLGHNNRKTS
jgi:hypothetical protein